MSHLDTLDFHSLVEVYNIDLVQAVLQVLIAEKLILSRANIAQLDKIL